MAERMSFSEIEKFAVSIRALLADPDADLNDPVRRRWEGALSALEAVLGQESTLVDSEKALHL